VKDRLGFLSGTGAVLAGLTVVGLLVATLMMGPVLFSPGALSARSKGTTYGGVKSHAQLAADCGACHTAPWSSRTMTGQCLACHTEVAAEVQAKNGVHGPMMGALTSPTCRGCHPDHGGAQGVVTVTDAASFPHDLTPYSLRGHRHKANGGSFTCVDCHPKDLAHFDQATCAGCHTTIDAAFMTRHAAQFGPGCLVCHDGSGNDAANFDHNKLPFKLTGKHAGVACDKCHTNTGSRQGLQNTPQDCNSCHAKNDTHQGRFGQQCGQCHTADGWANATFNHTIFPVNHGSRELKATCQTCHPIDVTTYTCFGCHTHTPANAVSGHEGRSLQQLTDCIRCHPGGRTEGGG
jgi:hypothetical protein